MVHNTASGLSPQKEAAIALLLGTPAPSLREVAEQIGMSLATLKRWNVSPAFREALDSARARIHAAGGGPIDVAVGVAIARRQHLEAATDHTFGLFKEAIDTLKGEFASVRGADRIRAAVAIISAGLKIQERGDLVARLEALEARAAGDGGPTGGQHDSQP